MINPISSVAFTGVEQSRTQDNFKGGMPAVTDVRGDYAKAVSKVDAVQQSTMKAVNSALGNNLDIIG